MPDKSLARRMKKLVKQWQKLATSLNGSILEASNVSSTPSPTKPISNSNNSNRSIGTIQSKQSSTFVHESTAKPNNITSLLPESHTMTTPTSFSPLPSLPSHPSETSLGSNHSTTSSTPRYSLDQTTPTNLHPFQAVNGQNINNDLVISLPLQRITKQQQQQQRQQDNQIDTSLIVKIPLIALKRITLPCEQHATPPPINSSLQSIELIVSINLSLLKNITINNNYESDHSRQVHRLQQPSAHIENSLTTFVCKTEPAETFLDKAGSRQSHSVGKTIHNAAAPSGRLKSIMEIPNGSSIGIDGCIGSDGVWYGWEDHVPSQDETVGIYPYVYVDGLTGYDKEQMWSSLDTNELTSILYLS